MNRELYSILTKVRCVAGVFSPGETSKGHSTVGADIHCGSESFPVRAMSPWIFIAATKKPLWFFESSVAIAAEFQKMLIKKTGNAKALIRLNFFI